MAVITSSMAVDWLGENIATSEPTLTSDDSAKTADGQATHMVDVWFVIPDATYAREMNIYGQRSWHHFASQEEARAWFEQVTTEH